MAGISSTEVAITGAGRGIGRGIASLMAAEGRSCRHRDIGASLEGTGIDPHGESVVDEIKTAGGQAIASTLSIAEPANAPRRL